MTDELSMLASMLLSAGWAAVTGDTFLPSLAGAAFAIYFRTRRNGEQRPITMKDIMATGVISFVFGIVVGPYFASQMPDGDGVVGVGALIMSFVAVSLLEKIYDGDVSEFLLKLRSFLTTGRGGK